MRRAPRARWLLGGLLVAALMTPASAQRCPAPAYYQLLSPNYPCTLIRTCSTDYGVCAIPFSVQPGTPCSCRAANGTWIPGVCTR
jgi:hypothetical protein